MQHVFNLHCAYYPVFVNIVYVVNKYKDFPYHFKCIYNFVIYHCYTIVYTLLCYLNISNCIKKFINLALESLVTHTSN